MLPLSIIIDSGRKNFRGKLKNLEGCASGLDFAVRETL
jgi:hypothetical protein